LTAVAVAAALLPALLAGAAAAEIVHGTTTPWPGGRWQPGPEDYGAEVVHGIPLTMSDGATLRASVAYPTDPATGERAPGSFPVILEHSPYSDEPNTYFTRHGYLSVVVRARGTGESGGSVGFWNDRDAEDGVEIVDWAAGLFGSNGRVGMYGGSWPGLLMLRTAAAVGPGSPLKAIVPAAAGFGGLARETFLPGGIPSETVTALPLVAAGTGGQPATTAYFDDLLAEILAGGDAAYFRDYWGERDSIEGARAVVDNGIPALLWSGWDDHVERSALETYAAFQNAYRGHSVFAPMRPGQRASGRYQIIVGDWGHGGGLDQGIMLEWYDTFVKGEKTGIARTRTPLHLYEKGSSRWINAARYPLVPDYSRLYLRPGGELSRHRGHAGGTGTLAWTQPDQPDGLLAFETRVLSHGATLAGPVAATVRASSSNANLELIASLYDVAPDGTATLITDGTVLGSQRRVVAGRSWRDVEGKSIRPYLAQEGDEYLVPGRPYRLQIALFPRTWGVAPGHRLRLTLTSQATDAVCASHITGSDPCTLTGPQAASLPGGEYTIRLGGWGASSVQLPLLPHGSLPTAASGATETSQGVELPLQWASPSHWRSRGR
jgi:hypothetical protein